jgi:putative ABC transport system substrate-binding protein
MILRRDFITLLGGAAAAWPLVAGAQQRQQIRRIAALFALPADDPISQVEVAGFLQRLAELSWRVGQNIQIDYRWNTGASVDPDRIREFAADALALKPDIVLVAAQGPIVGALQQLTSTTPVVFVGPIDPVGGGRVASLARPGGNVTGFMSVEYGVSAKLLELLKQVAPRTARVAVTRTPNTPGGIGQYAVIQGAAPAFRVELVPIDPRDWAGFERAITAFAREPNGGIIVPQSALSRVRREMIVKLIAQNGLPAVYGERALVIAGGLASYGPVTIDMYRQAAGYVDRILKGETPADLPVQAPTKYETALNLKTARALGLEIPATLLATADEVIE